MSEIIIGEDGEAVNENFEKFDLTNDDKRYIKSSKIYVLDFVGFIYKEDNLLAVFPKHFFDEVDRDKNKNANIKLLFDTIRFYNGSAEIKKQIGHENTFESDYPFEPFYTIYEYYIKYGVFKEEQEEVIKGINGKISWKKTIQKSDTIVSKGNLIYLPIFSKIKNHKYDFLSECMTFVINHTIETFPYFLDMKPIITKSGKIDFLSNIDYTLRNLYQYKNYIFKDYQKKLINALIDFFEQYRTNKKGSAVHFKINYFNLIWEKLVENYLNQNFVGINKEKRVLEFNDKKENDIYFNKVSPFKIDDSIHKYTMQPDHYYENDDVIYVFDSKYYEELEDLNYKQIAYTLLLGNSHSRSEKSIYSALLLPGHKENGYHLALNDDFKQIKDGCNYIIEQYLDVKMLMEKYINKNKKD